MATILDKDLIRETTVQVDNRSVILTLTEGQKISFKLKGMKSGFLTIGIEELYKQLRGDNVSESTDVQTITSKVKGDGMVSLQDLRSYNNISTLDYATKAKFDSIIADLIENEK